MARTVWIAHMEDVMGYELHAAGDTEREAREALRKTYERVRSSTPLDEWQMRRWCEGEEYFGARYLEVPLGSLGLYGYEPAERLRIGAAPARQAPGWPPDCL